MSFMNSHSEWCGLEGERGSMRAPRINLWFCNSEFITQRQTSIIFLGKIHNIPYLTHNVFVTH